MTDDMLLKRLVELEARVAFLDRFVDKAHNKAVEADIKAEVVKQMVEHQLASSPTSMGDDFEKLYQNDFGQWDNDKSASNEAPVHMPVDIPTVEKVEVHHDDGEAVAVNGIDAEPSPVNNQLYEEIMG